MRSRSTQVVIVTATIVTIEKVTSLLPSSLPLVEQPKTARAVTEKS